MSESESESEFKLLELRYTVYHWTSGEIYNGRPIITSVEIKPDDIKKDWKMIITHKYMLEKDYEEKIVQNKFDLTDSNKIIEEIEKINLKDLKNNYFTNTNPQKFTHWELEYNYFFKISGTFDQELDEIKRIKTLLNSDKYINEIIETIKNEFKPLEYDNNELYEIIEISCDNIKNLPVGTEFTLFQFLKKYEINEKQKYYLCEQILSTCQKRNIKIEEKYLDTDIDLPWDTIRIKK